LSFILKLRTKLVLYVAMFWPSILPPLLHFSAPRLSPRLADLRRRVREPIYVVTYARGLAEINGVPEKDVVVETQDLSFLNAMKQQGGTPTDLKVVLKERGERALLTYVDSIIAISPLEANFFRLFFDRSDVFYVPHFGNVRESSKDARSDSDPSFRYDVLFVGSDNVQNIKGIVAFINSYGDWLKEHSFAIVGKVCQSEDVRAYAETVGAHVLGFVDDVGLIYRASKIVVSPVDGTGLKIKVLEALSAGKPVFGSAHTLAGLPPGFEGCVLPISRHAMDTVISDTTARQTMERNSLTHFKTLSESGDLARLRQKLCATD